ncbi:DUF1330 domain-containing protein [Mesorhizobium tamadayense]|uniref:DUF1330 domain-containing protein n=1 Tax=Mesorhizobium tamadayense TaxID=425306 RepID=A0A3P3G5Z8_9HYPH|nr:DUF1330 domain-containing protein [Mesorhizobium tamadayense]
MMLPHGISNCGLPENSAIAKWRRWKATGKPGPLIVVEFPDMESARQRYRSAEYVAALEVRDAALSRTSSW